MLKLKLQYFDHLIQRTDSFEKTLMLGKIEAGAEGDDRGWDGWIASPPRGTWVWVSSGSWWWIGKPGVLQSMGSQRVGYDWMTGLNWTDTTVCKGEHWFMPVVNQFISIQYFFFLISPSLSNISEFGREMIWSAWLNVCVCVWVCNCISVLPLAGKAGLCLIPICVPSTKHSGWHRSTVGPWGSKRNGYTWRGMDLESERNMGALRLKRNEGEWKYREFTLGRKGSERVWTMAWISLSVQRWRPPAERGGTGWN